MKKFTTVLISCSLALAAAAFAQQPEDTSSPAPGKGKHNKGEAQAQAGANANADNGKKQRGGKADRGEANAQTNANANATNPDANANAGAKQGGNKAERRAARMQKNDGAPKTDASVGAAAGASASASPNEQQFGKQGRKGKNARGANANAATSTSPATSASPGADANASAASAGQQNATANNPRGGKKADPQKVQQVKQNVTVIKQRNVNFRAQPRPDKVPPVKFVNNYRIQNVDSWQGPQYEVFRSYRPERHDRMWYSSHFQRVELIGGGYYYWNNGYWYPAWGYDPGNEYYAYDAPIYVGHRAEPPDRVIADVQAELQEMGYYTGEVDGLLGPLTREALTAYQADNGLYATAVIDEPTLDSLGMG